MLPVVGLGVVGAELDDNDIRVEREGGFVGGLLDIRVIAFAQHGAGANPEVPDLVAIAQEHAQLLWIGLIGPVLDPRTVGDAVTDTGDPDFIGGRQRQAKTQTQ